MSYSTVKGPQADMIDLQGHQLSPKRRAVEHGLAAYGGTTWNALEAEARRERAANTTNFMTGVRDAKDSEREW